MKVSLLLFLLAAINFSSLPVCAGQTQTKEADGFVQENNTKRAQNPDGVSFTAAFKNNQKQFQQGETLKLELSFSTSTPKTYVLDTASYDRSGRLDMERLLQFPSGTVFRWKAVAFAASARREKQLFEEMKSHVEQHGMKLQRYEVDQ